MSFKVINFSSQVTPKAVESPAKDWVSYGDDNDYFQYLIDRYNGSAVNNAIISSVSDQIFGEGLSATDSNRKPLDFAKMRTIFKAEDLRRVAGDLKLLGQAAFNIVWNKGRTEILKAKHIPMQNLRPEKATEGEVKAWYYSDNWGESRKERYKPKRVEAFDGSRGEETQIMVIKPYAAGYFYFSPVDYAGALKWAEIDEEIGTYHLTNIQNGFAPSMMVNFNNGLPSEDEQRVIERKVEQKLQGTGGKKFLLSFNDDSSTATTIESLPISEASEQYKFLSEEATKKILVGHKVTSPMLFGIKDSTGLGNNADEIKTASQLWDNTVIKPKQNILLDAINQVLAVNNIVLDTYFKTLQPIEFIDTEGLDVEETEKETGVDETDTIEEVSTEEIEQVDASYNGAQISSAIDIIAKVQEGVLTEAQAITFLIQFLQLPSEIARGFFNDGSIQMNLSKMFNKIDKVECQNFSKEDEKNDTLVAAELIGLGEELSEEEWELIGDEDAEEYEALEQYKFVSSGTARPNANSEQDANINGFMYKVRYAYEPLAVSSNSRAFCRKMVNARKLYRKEDIIAMGEKSVNAGWGKGGANTYSIWKYKGGGDCHHKWRRKTFKSVIKVDVKSPLAPTVSTNQADKEGYRVRNTKEVAMKPKDMTNRGFIKKR